MSYIKPLIPFELISVYGARQGSDCILWHVDISSVPSTTYRLPFAIVFSPECVPDTLIRSPLAAPVCVYFWTFHPAALPRVCLHAGIRLLSS